MMCLTYEACCHISLPFFQWNKEKVYTELMKQNHISVLGVCKLMGKNKYSEPQLDLHKLKKKKTQKC